MARICLSLTESSLEDNLRMYARYRDHIDMVELRCDCLEAREYDGVSSFPAKIDLPVILTVRRRKDGGEFDGDEEARLRLLRIGSKGGYSYIELESDFRGSGLEQSARSAGVRVIRSFFHDRGIPDDLVSDMRSAVAAEEIPRAIVETRGSSDLESLLRVYGRLSGIDEYILYSTGDYGFATRVLAGKLGSAVSFCSASCGDRAAGKRFDPEKLDVLYRLRDINRETRVYGVIGKPVMHSGSPAIHNPAFRYYGMNAVYLPFETDEVASFFRIADLLDIRGFSVTMPFKHDVIPYLDRVSEEVDIIGSCNTVVKEEADGRKGYNTDAGGFIESLKPCFPAGLYGVRAAVLGAGGAAGAVVYALTRQGADVTVFNRTPAKAEYYAMLYGCSSGTLSQFENSGGFDLIVQATNVGMYPHENAEPAPGYRFTGDEIVYEFIYAPAETVFLSRARKAGCKTLNGLSLLQAQAELQFRHYTGLEYPSLPLE